MNFPSESNILDEDMEEDPSKELERNIRIYHSYTMRFSCNSLFSLKKSSKTLAPHYNKRIPKFKRNKNLTLGILNSKKKNKKPIKPIHATGIESARALGHEETISPVHKSRIPLLSNKNNQLNFFEKNKFMEEIEIHNSDKSSIVDHSELNNKRLYPKGKLLTRQHKSKGSIDFGLPELVLEEFVKILDKSEDEVDLVEEIQVFNLKKNISEIQSKYGMSLSHIFVILSNYSNKVNKYLMKTVLDLQRSCPSTKDNFNCSPFLYSKIFQNVHMTSILFDYLIHFKKKKAIKSSRLWWMKIIKIEDFSFKLKWSIKHKYIPFYGSITDEIAIVKNSDKILVEIGKVKGKGMKFKEYPSSFLFLPLAKKGWNRNSKKFKTSDSRHINPAIDRREREILRESEKDKGSLASYRIVCFDHVKERMAFLNSEFNLEEKKKIIEGYYLQSDKIVKKFETEFKKVKESKVKGKRTR